jgi:hypothetical protein
MNPLYCKLPSVKQDFLFIALMAMRKINWLHSALCQTSQSVRSSFFRSKKTSSTSPVKHETSHFNRS